MAQVKKANVPPTHPTVYVGLALAAAGLLVAMFAYTGSRIYDIVYAFVALAGGILALVGILAAAWGRSIMAARASRSRRGLMEDDVKKVASKKEAVDALAETPPTVAAPADKKSAGGVFAFRRREPAPRPADDPRDPAVAATLAPPAETVQVTLQQPAPLERVTLRCPQCATQFATEGVRPMSATCPSCGFSATI